MKLLLMLMFTAMPTVVANAQASSQSYEVPMEISVRDFDQDVSDVWGEVRKMIKASRFESDLDDYNVAIANHDPQQAQEALDKMVRDFPESAKQEPLAIKFHQATIYFWKKDFSGCYKLMDETLRTMEQKYPKGIPADHKYAEQNKRFMSQLYFGRGAAAMHLGKYNIAVADFTKAIAVYKPLGYMYGNKSRALFLLKKYKEAAEAYDMAYLITPEWALNAPDRKVLCATFKESGINPKACQSEEKDKSSNLK